MKGIPVHAHSEEVVQRFLGSSCASVVIANPEDVADPDNERELFVAAWCAHPDLVPDELIMAVPEPPEEHDGGPPLYLWPHKIIHNDLPALRYLVRLRLIEFQDWHTPPPSDDDEFYDGNNDNDDSGDNNFNGYHPDIGGGGGGARPRTTQFANGDEPRLGLGSGPAFRAHGTRFDILVGTVACPVVSARGPIPCRARSGKQVCGLGADAQRKAIGPRGARLARSHSRVHAFRRGDPCHPPVGYNS